MAEIIRNRTIRPSTRLEKSKSYKIDTKLVSREDILVVNIDHESKPFRKTYEFNGADVAHKDSISFRVTDFGTTIDISWSGASPIGTETRINKSIALKSPISKISIKNELNSYGIYTKTSFEPIASLDATILILGTMPGDKSIELGEYYGHSRNRFWKIISTITNHKLPVTYSDKKELLLKTKISIWDVAHKVNRKGSLDSAIEDEEPNDINNFIATHKQLNVVGFNGAKAEELFSKYFDTKPGLKYMTLPSTSGANTSLDFDSICNVWKQLLIT